MEQEAKQEVGLIEISGVSKQIIFSKLAHFCTNDSGNDLYFLFEAVRELRNPSLTKIENTSMCTRPVNHRTSGICGGSFSIEMTEEEYNTQLKEWEEKRKDKNV